MREAVKLPVNGKSLSRLSNFLKMFSTVKYYLKEKLPWRTTKNTTKQSAIVIIPTPVIIKLNIRFFLLASFFAASFSSSLSYTLGAFFGRIFNAFSEWEMGLYKTSTSAEFITPLVRLKGKKSVGIIEATTDLDTFI